MGSRNLQEKLKKEFQLLKYVKPNENYRKFTLYGSATERCRCSGLYFSSNHKVKGYWMGTTNRQLLLYYMPVFFDFLEQT